jgi:hypothetical protein
MTLASPRRLIGKILAMVKRPAPLEFAGSINGLPFLLNLRLAAQRGNPSFLMAHGREVIGKLNT